MGQPHRCIRETRRSSSTRFVGTCDNSLMKLICRPQGIGTLLMEEAERISREEHGSGRIAVISGELNGLGRRVMLVDMLRRRDTRLLPTLGVFPRRAVHG